MLAQPTMDSPGTRYIIGQAGQLINVTLCKLLHADSASDLGRSMRMHEGVKGELGCNRLASLCVKLLVKGPQRLRESAYIIQVKLRLMLQLCPFTEGAKAEIKACCKFIATYRDAK